MADLRRLGTPIRAIAAELGRSASTISRELLRRNADPVSGIYLPHTAQRLAAQRRSRPKPTRLETDPILRAFVDGRRRRRPQRYRRPRAGIVDPAVSIDARPLQVQDRTEAGHLEGALIIGRNGGTAIGTLVERTTRSLILVHLPERRTAKAMTAALVPVVQALPASLRRSLTWDQGNELAQHHLITAATGTIIYFCHAHSPWERGTNENMNGVSRAASTILSQRL